MKTRIKHLKVKIKSLADEARTIRSEERKSTGRLRCSLVEHRKLAVRPESRHSLLAYGFLRGVAYRRMEASCRETPNWSKVRSIANRFGAILDVGETDRDPCFIKRKDEQAKRFGAWLREAKGESLADASPPPVVVGALDCANA